MEVHQAFLVLLAAEASTTCTDGTRALPEQ